MSLWKKILLSLGLAVAVLVVAFVVVIGPWPTYSDGFEGKPYYTEALAALEKNVAGIDITSAPGPLQAGWGVNLITPEVGTPMAGYGAQAKYASTGINDDIYVKALALSDGKDVVVLVGADMLLIPDNIANMVREKVAQETPLTPNNIYFGASHAHSSVGAFGPGIVPEISFGKYDPKVPPFLAAAFTSAIVSAYNSMAPAKLAHGDIEAGQYIRNRTREAPTDTELSYLVVEKDNGDRYILASFSAHPTILSDHFLKISGEYPGFLQRALNEVTGAEVGYLGGAVGSMGPRAPEGATDIERANAMGLRLAQLIADDINAGLEFQTNLDVAAVGIPLETPPFQLRPLSTKWRVSPFVGKIAGVDNLAWMQGARVGDLLFVGVPADFSGEISAKWKSWATAKGYDMWVTSFSADYIGYVSPDEYYHQVTDDKGNPEYEIAVMSWTGPHQEAFFTSLMEHITDSLGPAQTLAKADALPATATYAGAGS